MWDMRNFIGIDIYSGNQWQVHNAIRFQFVYAVVHIGEGQ
jgi:hypothetical protein